MSFRYCLTSHYTHLTEVIPFDIILAGLVDAVECELVVSGQTRRWKEGHCLVFDDSFYHSVSNCGDNARAILIVDMWHPDLTLEQRRAITYLFPAVSDYPLSQELH